jgi:hypothetical protein
MPTQSTFDLLTEVRSDVGEIKHMLLGNGGAGLCEQVRQNARDVAGLTKTVGTMAVSVQTVSECQQVHRDWHAAPENMTIQQALARPGVRFVALLLIGVVVVVSASIGFVDAVAFVKGLL